MTEKEEVNLPSFRETVRERIADIAKSIFNQSTQVKARGFTPERAREVIETAKEHQDRLKDEVLAVGPRFDLGMKHLDVYSNLVKQYERKWLTNDGKKEWDKAAVWMFNDGFSDVIHAVEATKPSIDEFAQQLNQNNKE